MLAAILCNLPQPIHTSGPLRGFGVASTSWNPKWSETYGPDYQRAKEAKPEEVKQAVKALSIVKDLPEEIRPLITEAQEIIEDNTSQKITDDEFNRIVVMRAYYEYKIWQRRRNNIALLLLMD